MKSFVVISRVSPKAREASLKARKEAETTGKIILPEDHAKTRQAHREYMLKLKEKGEVFCAGVFADYEDAMSIFTVDSREKVDKIMREDPYVVNGYIEDYVIREWLHHV